MKEVVKPTFKKKQQKNQQQEGRNWSGMVVVVCVLWKYQ